MFSIQFTPRFRIQYNFLISCCFYTPPTHVSTSIKRNWKKKDILPNSYFLHRTETDQDHMCVPRFESCPRNSCLLRSITKPKSSPTWEPVRDDLICDGVRLYLDPSWRPGCAAKRLSPSERAARFGRPYPPLSGSQSSHPGHCGLCILRVISVGEVIESLFCFCFVYLQSKSHRAEPVAHEWIIEWLNQWRSDHGGVTHSDYKPALVDLINQSDSVIRSFIRGEDQFHFRNCDALVPRIYIFFYETVGFGTTRIIIRINANIESFISLGVIRYMVGTTIKFHASDAGENMLNPR